MIRYNNILRPPYDPPKTPCPKSGSRDPQPPGLTPMLTVIFYETLFVSQLRTLSAQERDVSFMVSEVLLALLKYRSEIDTFKGLWRTCSCP